MPVKLIINSQPIEAASGLSLFDYAERLGVRVPTSCHKQGKCRECLVEVVEGRERLSAPSEEERHLKGDFRLSCRARVTAESGPIVCHTLRRSAMRIETGAAPGVVGAGTPLDPAVTRDGDRVLLDGEEIDRWAGGLHGLAMDLGTTTVVLRLIDLESGRQVATASFENPQRFGGSDVMARIHYDTEHKGRLLQRTLLGYLTHAIEDLPVDPRSIYEVVAVGNPTMRDLFFGLDVHSIGQRPYRSITEHERLEGKRETTCLTVEARRLRLPIHPRARVVGLPLISGHVGADAAACLLAIDLAHEERLVALMDIGTNTELVVGNRHRILAASCPAGPAFEGGAVSCGMPALDGAIERIAIGATGGVEAQVIGGGPPEGICGSGLVDLLGELRRTERMNALGRLRGGDGRFAVDEPRDISLLEGDISELAQAKGANVAGLRIVLGRYGVESDDVERFYLAGGFARHIDVAAARRIGLIPDLPDEKIVQVGNAAIEGASIALLSRTRRAELEGLVRRIEHVELETDPDFFDHFVMGCQFQPLGLSAGPGPHNSP
jgi:uncharacterized 2Fe-2S/4Fe-4S cluster protein (DUF4445 family)